jgi:carboxypeptidase Q
MSPFPRAIRGSLLLPLVTFAAFSWPVAAQEKVDVATIERIKAEEMNHSKVMDIMSWLSDVYGPRLTWSPNIIKARDWTMGQMNSWGLSNVHEETWTTPVGLGWESEHFAMNATAPVPFIVQAVPQAWSASTKGTVSGAAVMLSAGCPDELKAKYAGKLKGAFVMTTPALNRTVGAFAATASRLSDSALVAMQNATLPPVGGRGGAPGGGRGNAPPAPQSPVCAAQSQRELATNGGRGGRGGVSVADTSVLRWFDTQGVHAIMLADASHVGGDIGTNNGASRVSGVPRVATVHVSQESYGRIARMLEKNVPVMLELNMVNKFYPANTTSFNIIGEIPGTDPALKDEVVMIGAHFDSWHSGTGATDNGAGSGVMLEAMRLLKTLNLSPRRTIRIGLWTGEEQGLLGSTAYVKQHFGTRDSAGFHALPEQAKLAAYFNLDNGSGKIRGIYTQGIEAERPIFDAWMGPFKEMGMKTTTIANTGGTDHLSYIGVGLPGFQFIQDPLDYGNVTHHTNQDVYERLQPDDLKFNSAVVAAFAWQAAERDEKLPRPVQPVAAQGGRGGM